MKYILTCLIIFLGTSVICESESLYNDLFTGKIYLAGSNKTLQLFEQENSIDKIGDRTILRYLYNDMQGNTATSEETVLKSGVFEEYNLEFTNPPCGCRLKRNEDTLKFTFTKGENRTIREIKYRETLATGPTLNMFIQKNWKKLIKGKKIYIYLPAMKLQKIIRCKIKLNKKSPYNRGGNIALELVVTNIFLRIFADPVEFIYNLNTRKLVEIHGRSLLKREVDGEFTNPVVDIYYSYKD